MTARPKVYTILSPLELSLVDEPLSVPGLGGNRRSTLNKSAWVLQERHFDNTLFEGHVAAIGYARRQLPWPQTNNNPAQLQSEASPGSTAHAV